MHPLFALLATRPQLLLDHAVAYAALFHEELGLARAAWQKQLVWQAMALCSLGVALVLGGVAVLLWAVTPVVGVQTAWVLVAVPLLPLALAAACQRLAHLQNRNDAFGNLIQQINADLALCRAVAAS